MGRCYIPGNKGVFKILYKFNYILLNYPNFIPDPSRSVKDDNFGKEKEEDTLIMNKSCKSGAFKKIEIE